MKQPIFKLALMSLALTAPLAAQAGMSEWFEKKFTFREEQKPLVAPQHTQVEPRHVISPYYDDAMAAEQTRYNQRPDLSPQPYLDSATMMMQPPPPQPVKQRVAPQQQQQQMYPGYPTGYAPMMLPPGYQMFAWRAYANQMQQQPNQFYIGEPGTNAQNPMQDPSQVGRKLYIGEPVQDWPAGGNRDMMANAWPRQGDYNYRQTAPDHRPTQTAGGGTVISNGMDALGTGMTQGIGQYPDTYRVEMGDTLSGISNKDQIYGDWKMWPLIYDANRNQIQDPDMLRPGWDLGIPRDYSQSDAASAKQRALEKGVPVDLYDGR